MRDEYFVAECMAGNACRVIDRSTEEVVGLTDRVSGVDADPDADRRRRVGKDRTDRELDRLRRGDSPARARERKHRSVALCFYDRSAVRDSCLSDHVVVPPNDFEPCVAPKRAVRTVESTMSVKTIVTVPSAARLLDKSGRSRWIVCSSCSRETGKVTPHTSSFDFGTDQCTFTSFHSPRSRWSTCVPRTSNVCSGTSMIPRTLAQPTVPSSQASISSQARGIPPKSSI